MTCRRIAPLLSVLLIGCKTTSPETSAPSTTATSVAPAPPAPKVASPHAAASETAATTPAPPAGEEQLIAARADPNSEAESTIRGEQLFASRLYSKLPHTGNLAFSPASLRIALGMAYSGARGETATEMAKALSFGERDETQKGLAAELHGLRDGTVGASQKLYVTNRLWGQKGTPFNPQFLSALAQDFDAPLGQLDLAGDPNGSRAEINAFIDQTTLHMVKDVVPPGAIEKGTRFVITNAVYFKGLWKAPFTTKAENEDFFVSKEKTVHLPLMRVEHAFRYAKLGGYQLVELPYEGDATSMLLAIPEERFGLAVGDDQPIGVPIESWLAALEPVARVRVELPRFKMGSALSMKAALSALGMTHAFTREANFEGIDGTRTLLIDSVLHKARVEVDEKGTEASAATVVMGRRPLAVRMPDQPLVVRADHPFLFLIRDAKSGSVLFLGRIVDPT